MFLPEAKREYRHCYFYSHPDRSLRYPTRELKIAFQLHDGEAGSSGLSATHVHDKASVSYGGGEGRPEAAVTQGYRAVCLVCRLSLWVNVVVRRFVIF